MKSVDESVAEEMFDKDEQIARAEYHANTEDAPHYVVSHDCLLPLFKDDYKTVL